MKINAIGSNNRICRFKGTVENRNLTPAKKDEDLALRINDYAIAKPAPLIRNEISQYRRNMLIPVSNYKEYCNLKDEIFKYKDKPKPNMLIPPFINEWGYENIEEDLKGLVCYCGADDKSNIIISSFLP